jgi:hypothetical protein
MTPGYAGLWQARAAARERVQHARIAGGAPLAPNAITRMSAQPSARQRMFRVVGVVALALAFVLLGSL